MTILPLSRRRLLQGSASLAATTLLVGCDALVNNGSVDSVVQAAETALTERSQRLILSHGQLAREFTEADMSPVFKVNGTEKPEGEAYARLIDTRFMDWKLAVCGNVQKPLELSLADLKRCAHPNHATWLRPSRKSSAQRRTSAVGTNLS